MKANEFVKDFGVIEAKKIVKSKVVKLGLAREIADWKDIDFDELKRLIESWELVFEHGSAQRAKDYADSKYTAPEIAERLKQAIADVESFQ